MVRICNSESAIATCDNFKLRPNGPKPKNFLLRRFSYSDLQSATSFFSASSFLGKGSHGAVYRAILDSGSLIAAVKRSTHSSSSSDNEINILSNLRGPGLVNLIGYSLDPSTNRLLLVVQHMPNGSLYDLLHKSKNPLSWTGRVRVGLHVGRALAFLHAADPPVIHRDIKSSNVLIDGHLRARLSDFGLAIRGQVEDIRALKTPPAGTLGYLDPCYLAPGDVCLKSDVFSFGILLLEIISGRRAIDVDHSPPSIEEWALPLIRAGKYDAICDRRIRCPPDRRVIVQMAHLAVRCVRSDVEKRPDMVDAVECLTRVYQRVRSPMWNGFKTRVVKSRPLISFESCDEREGADDGVRVRVCRRPLSRSRKVSSVPSLEEAARAGVSLGGRSKSFGSVGEFGIGSEVDSEVNSGVNAGKQKVGPHAGVKFGGVKLRRSRSVGVGSLAAPSAKFTSLLDGKTRVEGVKTPAA